MGGQEEVYVVPQMLSRVFIQGLHWGAVAAKWNQVTRSSKAVAQQRLTRLSQLHSQSQQKKKIDYDYAFNDSNLSMR